MTPRTQSQLLLDRIVAWLRSGRDSEPRAIFSDDVEWDDPLHPVVGKDFFESLKIHAPLSEIVVIDQVVGADKLALIFEARDPVTNLWHRVAWTMTIANGRIATVHATNGCIHRPTR